MRICKTSKWTVPVFSLALGAVVCAALALAGRLGLTYVASIAWLRVRG